MTFAKGNLLRNFNTLPILRSLGAFRILKNLGLMSLPTRKIVNIQMQIGLTKEYLQDIKRQTCSNINEKPTTKVGFVYFSFVLAYLASWIYKNCSECEDDIHEEHRVNNIINHHPITWQITLNIQSNLQRCKKHIIQNEKDNPNIPPSLSLRIRIEQIGCQLDLLIYSLCRNPSLDFVFRILKSYFEVYKLTMLGITLLRTFSTIGL